MTSALGDERIVEVDGVRLHVAERGEGEPVVLLHTTFQHAEAWRKVVPALAQSRRVICPDMRGCGRSEAPPGGYAAEELADELCRLLDALELERVQLVGHGYGGFVGFFACLRHPERISRYLALGVVHPWLRADPRFLATLWRSWYQPLVASPGGGGIVRRRAFTRWLFRRTSPRPEAWSDEDLLRYDEPLAEPARARAMSLVYRRFLLGNFWPLLSGGYRERRLTVPTLLLFGEEDPFLSPRALRGFEPYADEMTVELLAGEGHFLAEEHPELVVTRALRFLEGASASPASTPGAIQG